MQQTARHNSALNQFKTTMFSTDSQGNSAAQLRTPREARKEMETMREHIAQIKEFNEKQRFLGRRDRLLRTGWRHGILGIDDADSDSATVFYATTNSEKKTVAEQKDIINKRRQKSKCPSDRMSKSARAGFVTAVLE